jgi:DNA-directed RNA polymerase subunit RPC12/RpoP
MKRKRIICPRCKERVVPKHFANDYPYVISDSCPECGYIISLISDYETMGANSSLQRDNNWNNDKLV